MKKGINRSLVIAVVIEAIVIAGLLGYIFCGMNHNSSPSKNFAPGGNGNFMKGNGTFAPAQFQINQSAQAEVTSVFESGNQSEISSYCQIQANAPNCMYYCRNINSQDQYCTTLNHMRFGGGTQ